MPGLKAPLNEMVPGHAWLLWSNSKAGWLTPAMTGATRIIENAGRFDLPTTQDYINAQAKLPLVHGKQNAVAVPDPSLDPVRPFP